jgi:hypothetical protein
MPENTTNILHKIRAKLYLNYLPLAKGKYIARSTRHEAPLSVEAVCQSAKNRGGYVGNVDNMIVDVKAYQDEAVFLLADGYALKNKYYAQHQKVGGTVDRADTTWNREKNPIVIVHTKTAEMDKVFNTIEVVFEGAADVEAYIDEVMDMFTGTIDDTITPGENIIIHGNKIKFGDDDSVEGLFLTNQNTGEVVKVPRYSIPENGSTKIIAKVPGLAAGIWRLKIVTQVVGSTALKDLRTILYEVDLQVI